MRVSEADLKRMLKRGARVESEQPATELAIAGLPVSADTLALNPELSTTAAHSESKYGNRKTDLVIGDVVLHFDSEWEAQRYQELRLLQSAGEISNLLPSPERPKKPRFDIGGGRVYEPDYTYIERGQLVAEDAKGSKQSETDVWRLKAALFRERYPELLLRVSYLRP